MKRGFSLIELIVVIAILALIALSRYRPIRDISSGFWSGVLIGCIFWHDAGVINQYCYYWYGTSRTSSQTDAIMPGWSNANSGTTGGLENYNAVRSSPSYLAATCL